MDDRRRVKFGSLKYNLKELFRRPPIFDVPPLQFRPDYEVGETFQSHEWEELYELLLGETRMATQSLEYLKMVRDRHLLQDVQPHARNMPFLYVKKSVRQMTLEDRKKRLARALQE